MNNISTVGTDALETAGYQFVDDPAKADAWLVRSANLHEIEGARVAARHRARRRRRETTSPVERCAEQGIVVFNTPGANANAVKELFICGMLLACRDVIGGIEWVSATPWTTRRSQSAPRRRKKRFAGCELAGKRVGVIGLGAIGAQVADALIALGAEVMGIRPLPLDQRRLGPRTAGSSTRPTSTSSSRPADFVTLHVPATDATKGMISAEAISKMKRGAVLLNFARDALVDEQALAEALDDGHLARYVDRLRQPREREHEERDRAPAPRRVHRRGRGQLRRHGGPASSGTTSRTVNIANSVNYGRVDLGPLVGDHRIALFHQNAQGVIGQLSQVLADASLNIEKHEQT